MIKELSKICELIETASLKDYNTFRFDCSCFAMIKPNNEGELIAAYKIIKQNNYKYFVIGNGSNIILPEYYDGIIISLEKFNKYEIKDNILYAESGCMINKLATEVSYMGYKGLEFASGIPGSIGGSIVGNAGAYNSSISAVLISARVFDGEKIIELNNKDFKFEYRNSILKTKKDKIILSCKIKLEKYDSEKLKQIILENTKKRILSQDLTHPSNGSVFRNPTGAAAWKLIDDLGLKNYKIGGAYVSPKHANFIVSDGTAKSSDVIKLIKKIKKEVKKQYNIDLVLEQEIIK